MLCCLILQPYFITKSCKLGEPQTERQSAYPILFAPNETDFTVPCLLIVQLLIGKRSI